MFTNAKTALLLGAMGISLQWGNPQSAMAGDEEHYTLCRNATLKGTYLFAYIGWSGIAGERKPAAYAGREIYNGDGTLTGIESFSEDGHITRHEEYTGTYTVNSDCTATVEITAPSGISHYDYFIAPSGEEFIWVQTDEGTVSASNEHRVKRRVYW